MKIQKPGYYYLEINQDYGRAHPLYIFVDEPQQCDFKPGMKNLHYFGPGYHDIGINFPVLSGETVFLAPGAFVEGNF